MHIGVHLMVSPFVGAVESELIIRWVPQCPQGFLVESVSFPFNEKRVIVL